ncbi:MAG: YlbF family regulator [Syntrophomonadaceae bacterium]|nr:YlbF family regulator [Syntrophomonadaceae bacterium]
MSTENIIKQAFTLGDLIAQSEEINQLKELQVKLTEDQAAYDLIMRYQEAVMKLENKRNSGLIIPSNEEDHIAILEQQLNSNALVNEMMVAQEKFDNLMQAVYFALNQAISGSNSCADGCDSCGGTC